ncbi:MAG: hypothetical protein ABSH56_25485 [Bryobacteraceae bacterium]
MTPALEFHPTTETILERIGVGENWRSDLRVMFRLNGAERPGL